MDGRRGRRRHDPPIAQMVRLRWRASRKNIFHGISARHNQTTVSRGVDSDLFALRTKRTGKKGRASKIGFAI